MNLHYSQTLLGKDKAIEKALELYEFTLLSNSKLNVLC